MERLPQGRSLAATVPASRVARRRKLHGVVALVSAVVALGCTPKALGPLDATHPASPEATEAVLNEPGTGLDRPGPETDRERAAPAPPMSHGHGTMHGTSGAGTGEDAAAYVCPMHPDVRRPGPGTCPRCGMTLVRRQGRPEKEDGGHAH